MRHARFDTLGVEKMLFQDPLAAAKGASKLPRQVHRLVMRESPVGDFEMGARPPHSHWATDWRAGESYVHR